MQQYFVSGQPAPQVTITDPDTIRHMFSVMRLADGDEAVLVFDDGIKRLARVASSSAHTFDLGEELAGQTEMPVRVTIAAGFPKGDKLELLTQKATELGAAQIWAYPAAWSVVKWDRKKLAKKADKLTKIARGAAEQSKRNQIPPVRLFDSQADFLAQLTDFDKILIAYEEAAKAGESSGLAREIGTLTAGQRLLLVFGPEGGIAPDELEHLKDAGGIPVGLGPRIMRAETAPLYALAAVSCLTELQQPEA